MMRDRERLQGRTDVVGTALTSVFRVHIVERSSSQNWKTMATGVYM